MVVNSRIFFVFLIFGGILFPPNLHADTQELVLREELTVYKKPRNSSDVLILLEAGEKVPVSTRDYGAWKKIKVEAGGKTQFGWVKNSDIKKSRIRVVDTSTTGSSKGAYHTKRGAGIFYHFSYVSIGEFEFATTNPALDVTVKDLTGVSSFFGFHYDYPWNDRKMVRFFFSLRENDVEGDGTFSGNIFNSVEFTQSMMAFGATLKNYKDAKANSWWGYGLEVAKITEAEVTRGSTKTEVPDDELPFYILPHLALGYDFPLSGNIYLLLDAKLLFIINADDFSYALDSGVSFSYSF